MHMYKKFDQFVNEDYGHRLNEARQNVTSTFEAWERNRPHKKADSIWTDGEHIYSYGTCLVARDGKKVVLNMTEYSSAISNHQQGLKYFLSDTDFEVEEVTDLPSGVSSQQMLIQAGIAEGEPSDTDQGSDEASDETEAEGGSEDTFDTDSEGVEDGELVTADAESEPSGDQSQSSGQESGQSQEQTQADRFPMPDRIRENINTTGGFFKKFSEFRSTLTENGPVGSASSQPFPPEFEEALTSNFVKKEPNGDYMYRTKSGKSYGWRCLGVEGGKVLVQDVLANAHPNDYQLPPKEYENSPTGAQHFAEDVEYAVQTPEDMDGGVNTNGGDGPIGNNPYHDDY